MPIYNNEPIVRALLRLPDDLPAHEDVFAAPRPELEKAPSLAGQILTSSQRSRVNFLEGASRAILRSFLAGRRSTFPHSYQIVLRFL